MRRHPLSDAPIVKMPLFAAGCHDHRIHFLALNQDSVYVLANSERTLELLEWVAAELREAGGDASVWEVAARTEAQERDMREFFLEQGLDHGRAQPLVKRVQLEHVRPGGEVWVATAGKYPAGNSHKGTECDRILEINLGGDLEVSITELLMRVSVSPAVAGNGRREAQPQILAPSSSKFHDLV